MDGKGRVSVTETKGKEWTLFAAGDVCPRERLYDEYTLSSHLRPDLRSKIQDAELSIANLEGPLQTDIDPIVKNGPAIAVDRPTPSFLSTAGFDGVFLANNHIMDYGETALRETLQECHDCDLQTCGAGSNLDEALSPARFTVNGTSIAVISLCEQEFGIATEDQSGSAWISHPKAILTVAEANNAADVVIVSAHGGVENVPIPPTQRQRQLRQFVEAGADVIIGHHPHVPQGWEQYEDGLIFYSLGNFLFNRSKEQVHYDKEQWGIAVTVTFSGEEVIAFKIVPVELRDGPLSHAVTARDEYLDHINRLATLTADRDTLIKYWRQLSVRRFVRYNSRHIRRTCTGGIFGTLRYPVTRRHLWDQQTRKEEMLWLLNHFRNESHRWSTQTALAVLSGQVEVELSDAVSRELDELLDWTRNERYDWAKTNL